MMKYTEVHNLGLKPHQSPAKNDSKKELNDSRTPITLPSWVKEAIKSGIGNSGKELNISNIKLSIFNRELTSLQKRTKKRLTEKQAIRWE